MEGHPGCLDRRSGKPIRDGPAALFLAAQPSGFPRLHQTVAGKSIVALLPTARWDSFELSFEPTDPVCHENTPDLPRPRAGRNGHASPLRPEYSLPQQAFGLADSL